jgi:hypothetical protein
MFEPRRPLISVPAFPSSDLCALCVSAFSSLPSFCSGGSSDPCSSPTLGSFDATIPFRITSFAHPNHLTPIESYSCKKHGRGVTYPAPPPNSTQSLPIFSTASKHSTHSSARNFNPFIRLLNGSLDTRGWGILPRAASTTHYPLFPTHYSLLTVLPQNFYPPAPKLRHNPAAQGHHPQSSSQTGRIQ